MVIRLAALTFVLLGPVAGPALAQAPGEFEAAALPTLKRYCLECHSAEEQEGDLDLERFVDLDRVRSAPRVWQRVAEVIEKGEMPPKSSPQPADAERARLRDWAKAFLAAEASRRAGDPGRVVLRRLNNAEYTFTLRDLTGVDSLEPAREFPADGAAGEGFTNTGNSLVMSPSLLTKYLDAAKDVADHAVLLPEGLRFSPGTTARDRTEEALARIHAFYREFTDPRVGGDRVDPDGIVLDTNKGGRLPLDRYLAATIADRPALASGSKTAEAVALEHGLNARYLGTLLRALNSPEAGPLLGDLRARWRSAGPADVPALVAEVEAWQKALWKFSSVGHIGKVGGPKAWMEPVSPIVATREVRLKLPLPADGRGVTVSLVATDAGDGSGGDLAAWRRPRLVAPGRPEIPLKDLRRVADDLARVRDRLFADTPKYLEASDEVEAAGSRDGVDDRARARGLDPDSLRAWLDYLGIAPTGAVALTGHLVEKRETGGGHAFINGWGLGELPILLANSSDQAVRIPGNMKPHGVAVHPSPTLRAAVGWRSPVAATVRVEATITHAHPECGNGVTWTLELRRGTTRRLLAEGTAQGNRVGKAGPVEGLAVGLGDVVTLAIGPRDGSHACDLTAIDLRIIGPGHAWDLAADVSGDVLAGNPHADRLGHPGVWHFLAEPDQGGPAPRPVVPAGSALARWQGSKDKAERSRLAEEARRVLAPSEPGPIGGPDAALRRQARSLAGPLLVAALRRRSEVTPGAPAEAEAAWGLDPSLFGHRPDGTAVDGESLSVRAPAALSFAIPAELAEGAELVATVALDADQGTGGSIQAEAVVGVATSSGRLTLPGSPIIANDGTASRARIEAAFSAHRDLFPAALCYARIVPVDEVVTLTLFHREDGHLARLMLDEGRKAELDRLWDELHFIGRDALTLVDAYAQLMEFATQDGDPRIFEPLRKPIHDRAAAFRRLLVESEPRQVAALIDFAARAYRRPLSEDEAARLRGFYSGLRAEQIPHDEALRLTLARILVAPAFLYRAEEPGPGSGQGPVGNFELATRLGYFLWSSTPDAELLGLAGSGRLADPDVLAGQARRMVRDPKARRLATEFACRWLQIADFDRHDEKSERHFPTFPGLRGAMYEESVRFFTDLFQGDGSVLGILDADHTFLNGPLAEHYGIPLGPAGDPNAWRRVEGIRSRGRGGVLGQATTLATQSGASRTSPTLRGNWIGEVLLGERLPRPPKGVPPIPDDEAATAGLTVRQVVERHASDTKCAACHRRIDPMGFALEGFDAIGRLRKDDLGGRPIDARASASDGATFEGLGGLRDYLLTARRDAFLGQFCRKLLGFALGRSTELSDEPLLAEMQSALKANDYRVGAAVEAIVRSRQFREIRGRETAYTD